MERFRLLLFIFILTLAISAAASSEDFTVSDVSLSSTDWGTHLATIKITCLAEYYRFLVATAEVDFPGSIYSSKRITKKSYILMPPDQVTLKLPYSIPGDIGEGTVLITLYDVVDTLDPLLESQKFYERTYNFNIKLPVKAQMMVDSGIQVPSLLGRTETFNNMFNRLLMLLLHQEKSPADIAQLAGVTVEYVDNVSKNLEKQRLLEVSDNVYRPTFVFIDEKKAAALKPAIDKVADEIYDRMVKNIAAYDSAVTVMAAKGIITDDQSNVLQGGSVLYHKFPTFLGLFFWDFLGSRFINGNNEMVLFENSDPCQARLGDYMFMVTGPEDNVGTTFYNRFDEANSKGFYCGARAPKLICDGSTWAFEKENSPIYYTYNKSKTDPALTVLDRGMDPYLIDLENSLAKNFPSYKEMPRFKGARYWCWGLIVDKLMKRLIDNGYLEQEGNGTFLLQETKL
jgi:DNA-binding MarR family transcriptional regulator